MRNFIVLSAVFVCFLGYARFSYGQSETTMQDILETVNGKITELEDEKDQEIVNITLDLLVDQGTKSVIRYLDPAFNYMVIAFGDRRISKLKLTIYKKVIDDWVYVNDATGANPQMNVTPSDFDQFRFTVTVDEFKENNTTGHFALLIYHRNPEKKK